VSFKDANGKYLRPISTGKKTEKEAVDIAFIWLRDGIPQDKTELSVHHLSLKDVARKIKTEAEAEIMLSELRRLCWVKSYVLNATPDSADFISFLKNIWDWDNSPYIKEKLRKFHGIHKRHCKLQWQAINQYWKLYFENKLLGEISSYDIGGFINHNEGYPYASI